MTARIEDVRVAPGRPDPAGERSARRVLAFQNPVEGWTSLAQHRARLGPPPPRRDEPWPELIDAVDRAGLRGRGGAGFPTATKMRAVIASGGRPIVVANGSEGEPASHKDETLMATAPHLVLDGALTAAAAVGADEVICAVVFHTGQARRAMHHAVEERFASERGGAKVRIVDVPPRYVAGEERSLVNLLNGGPPIPTPGPLRPFQRGVDRRPTLVQNVETLCHLALVRRFGPDWFRAVGTRDAPGTTLVTLSGGVAEPGVFEIALGTPLASLLKATGGTPGGTAGVLVGGYSGTWLTATEAETATLDPAGMAAAGGILGCGVVAVVPRGGCGVRETAAVIRWMADQTAGQCGPCVYGLAALAQAAERLADGRGGAEGVARIERWAADVEGRGACRFPDGAVRLLRSALRTFGPDVERHASGRPCAGAALPPALPTPAVPGMR